MYPRTILFLCCFSMMGNSGYGLFPVDYSMFLRDGATNVCKKEWYVKKKTSTGCSFWKWGRCTRYRTEYHFKLSCCSGWQNYVSDLGACKHAICNGEISPHGACNNYYSYDYIMYRSLQVVRSSGGTCSSPGYCSSCNDGFYSSSGECLICPKIANCYHRACSHTGNNICKYCHGEVKSKRYWRAYTPDIDAGKTCQKACSWRSDSTRCFPGTCSNEIATSCTCVPGFTGTHCEQITENPRIEFNHLKLEDGSLVVDNPADLGADYAHPMPTVWTKEVGLYFVNAELKAKYTIAQEPSPKPDSSGEAHYVTHWAKGVIGGAMYLRLYRGGSVRTPVISKTNCPGSWLNPIPTNYGCQATFYLSQPNWGSKFLHDDILEAELSVTNGGFVEIMNRESNDKKIKYALKGQTETRKFTYHFDTVSPYQSCVKSGGGSCNQPVTAPDLTADSTIHFSWNDWTDDLSQLKHYSYEVHDMTHDGRILKESKIIKSEDAISLATSTTSFLISSPGMYSLLFVAWDNAGNHKTARKVFLFDDKSKVEKQVSKVFRAVTASHLTQYKWVTEDTSTVQVEFINRFINVRHSENRWLNAVNKYPDVDTSYDDKYGKRTVNAIDNVNAIVDFKVSYNVNSSVNTVRDSRVLTSIPKLHDQAESLSLTWVDGDSLEVVVRAIDVMDVFDEDKLQVYRDATPAIIEDLWLTRGVRKDIYVHNVEEFTEMTIEWDAYDYHSGIDSLYWKLYDNYTKTVVEHGHEDLIAQGNTQTLAACQALYGSDPGLCYCTPFWGCFHKHFTVKPKIVLGAGLHVGKDRGVHDYDYYIEVKVTNIAKLVTTEIKKITIDVSPPHTGVVHDGVNGTLEVDYQQSKTLNAHWDGFFDRESGVKFYLYNFDTSCQDSSAMVLDSGNPKFVETTSRHATYTVTSEGKYYVTVVAFNRALEPSKPVCSDGVTVDTTTPSVREIAIEHARVHGGLITNQAKSEVWVLGNDRVRRLVENVTSECWSKATVTNSFDLYPLERDRNGDTVVVDGYKYCENTSSAPSALKIVVSKSSMMMLSWQAVNNPGGIYDYQLGISRTVLGAASPDLMGFVSSKQHAHFTIKHADLPDGTEFYFHLKSISKSEIEGIQSIGPCIMDTTAPDHSGQITVALSEDYLVASWSSGDFIDTEDFYDLTYHFAIGNEALSTSVQNYEPVRGGGGCVITTPPSCTAALVTELDWQLHGHHTYYVSIKAENTAGLYTLASSLPYVHDVQLASRGIVLDIAVGTMENGTDIPYMDIEDIDFQTSKKILAARWSGFVHPHLEVTYRVFIGTTVGGSDVLALTDVANKTAFESPVLSLAVFQTYYFTVEAVTSVGSVNVTSDGVTVVQPSAVLSGIQVHDGKLCDPTAHGQNFKHHDEDNRVKCVQDIDFQASLNTIQAYWIIPDNMKFYTPDIYWAVEIQQSTGHQWTSIRDYQHIPSGVESESHDFALLPGQTYRSVIKICARETCYTSLYTDGVTILSSPPRTGSLSLNHFNTTQTGDKEKLEVRMSRFFDPDVEDSTAKYDVIDKYEWAITDNSHTGKIFTQWTMLIGTEITVSGGNMDFSIELNGTMDFSRCKRFSVRGYNKAKLWSVVTADIKSCTAFDPLLVIPNKVKDAFGDPEYEIDGSIKDGYGKPIFLSQNQNWNQDDVDYSPYTNYISAVWPKLRHSDYKYAVLEASAVDVTTYYLPTNQLSLPDPCGHPDAIPGSCGTTKSEYVNVKFSPGKLVHGKRYMVCIHAKESWITQENGNKIPVLEANLCSDGVVIDLTKPRAGNVWIGHTPNTVYQTTKTHLYVNWESFEDIEEFNTNSHASGIKSYEISVGTSPGGNDIVAVTDTGVINHIAFHNLNLQDGHRYYATIKAMDFVGRSTTVTSNPVVVDTTPPAKSDNPITITGRHITSNSEISACWKGVFSDLESGIYTYTWSIGSRPGYDDIMTYTNISDVECAVSDVNKPLNLQEGHAYYVNVRAYNGAKHYTQASSWAFVVDLTPPIPGHVYDGKRNKRVRKDDDFQTDPSYIAAFWEGFHDPHSTIQEYRVSVGTCPKCVNILQEQPIGITEDFLLPINHLGVGLTYYTTVTACNTADMCTSVTSDGVVLDNSPPSPGVVQDGTGEYDTHYQYERTYIGAKWFGFTDPQSGLERYEWWAGTVAGSDDLMAKTRLHLEEVATNPKLTSLPIAKTIYITVRAYNKAGLYSDSTSNGFTIDTTAPAVTSPVLLRNVGSVMPDSIVFRNSFKVSWTSKDQDTNIQRQYLSMKAHRGGEFHLASTKVSGIVRDFTFSGLELHDGVKYYVTLIACNGAGICSNAESKAILVDSSPPSRGMFAIATNHAADVERHVPYYMTWVSKAVHLSWLGFADLHSDIDYYMISIGSSFLTSDLNKNSGAAKVSHSELGHVYDEGYVQTAKIETSDLNKVLGGIYISMYAVNTVGLTSPIIHSKFNTIPGGSLELVRRCEAYSCKGHCVCAPQDQLCPSATPCVDKTGDSKQSQIRVKDVLDFRSFLSTTDGAITPSDMCLAGHWDISLYGELPPLWYEWSVGFEATATPEGVFHQTTERVWHDAGQNKYKIFTVPRGTSFHDTVKYSFFVRVWFKPDTFAIFKSNGIEISNGIASGISVRRVTEYNLDAVKMNDMDYIKYYPFAVNWKHKFINAEERIEKFDLYLSTFPGGHDVYEKKLTSWTTSYNFRRFNLEPQIKFYSNVIAYSKTGAHYTESSDGFTIDDRKPQEGMVYDGTGLHDIEFQSFTDVVSAAWHGYVDLGAGIHDYRWCVGLTHMPSECDVMAWTNVGLKTAVISNTSSPLKHGDMIYSKVYAIDRVGQASTTVVSDGVKIDTTPPVSQLMVHEEDVNLAKNPSFETTRGKELKWSDIFKIDICSLDTSYEPLDWERTEKTCTGVISSDVNLAKSGRTMVMLRGVIQQSVTGLTSGGFYRITFSTSHLPAHESVLANKEGFVEFANTRFVFLLYTKSYRRDEHGRETREIISWHKHTFYFHARSVSENLIIGALDRTTGMLVDDVLVHKVTLNETGDDNTHSHIEFLHDWGSIHGSWSFVEDESNIVDYQWGIGYTKGGTQIQPFKSVGLANFAYNNNVTLVHKSNIYVTAIATNSAGLQGVSYSTSIRVDLTGPDITEVNDGADIDLDSWEQDEVLVNFKVVDPESGIKYCEWAIGTQSFGNEIQTFVKLSTSVTSGMISKIGYDKVEGRTVYSTIRCENNGGLQSIKSSDGVKISSKAPNTTFVDLQVMPLTRTVYQASDYFQSVTDQIRLKWTGFVDFIGLEGFIFSIQSGGNPTIWRKIHSYDQVYAYVQIDQLSLPEGVMNLTLKAVNLQLKSSPEVNQNVTLSLQQPKLHATKGLQVSWDNLQKEIVVSWADVFSSEYSLYYEVSAGTEVGGGDVVQWMETKHTSITFGIPPTVKEPANSKIFVVVRAVSASGIYINKSGSIQLPANM